MAQLLALLSGVLRQLVLLFFTIVAMFLYLLISSAKVRALNVASSSAFRVVVVVCIARGLFCC